jgi:hypothetical protein
MILAALSRPRRMRVTIPVSSTVTALAKRRGRCVSPYRNGGHFFHHGQPYEIQSIHHLSLDLRASLWDLEYSFEH